MLAAETSSTATTMMLHSNVIVKFLNGAEPITNRLTILTLTKCASKCFKIKTKHSRTAIQNEDKKKIKNKRDLLHRLRNKRIERERERERETPTHAHKHMHNPYPALEGCEVTVTDVALSRFLIRRRVGHDTLLSPAKTS
jgi:hypothetical protein